MNDLLTLLLLLAIASVLITGMHFKQHPLQHVRAIPVSDMDIDEDMNYDIDGDDEQVQGNGFEYEGLKGHHGLFTVFNWTREELAKISIWHATAQHFKAAKLVEQKLAALNPYQPFPREQIQLFLIKFRTPQSVRQLFSKQQIHRIRDLHIRQRVNEITNITCQRLMQLDAATRQEVLDYFRLTTTHET